MAGYLYAVIFEQGTVKVGMSERDPKYRMAAAINESKRWRIPVYRELSARYETPDVGFRELALCGFCKKFGEPVDGYEWFKFKSAELAEEKLMMAFSLIKNDVFGTPQCRNTYDGGREINDRKFAAAMVLIRKGVPAHQAANMVDTHHMVIYNRKEYKDWFWKSEVEALADRIIEV